MQRISTINCAYPRDTYTHLSFSRLPVTFTADPDLTLIENGEKRAIVLLSRVLYTALLLFFRCMFKYIKTYRVFSVAAGCLQLLALAVFLYVFHAYEQPDFQIQAMGLITLIVMYFLFPGHWAYTLGIAILGSASFFLFAGSGLRPCPQGNTGRERCMSRLPCSCARSTPSIRR
jgi:hypothetical protein